MANKVSSWFYSLTSIGKIVTVAAVLGVTGVAASAVTPQRTSLDNNEPIYKIETVKEPVTFESKEVTDAGLEYGKRNVTVEGADGEKSITYQVEYTNGIETNRSIQKEEITLPPVTRMTSVGSYVAPPPPPPQNCNTNYSGCVPNASDVDCAAGSGNGPAYISGPVYVIGSDVYGLDRDGDGVGCE